MLIIFCFLYLQVNDIACSADVTVIVRALLRQAEKGWDLTYHCILCLCPVCHHTEACLLYVPYLDFLSFYRLSIDKIV